MTVIFPLVSSNVSCANGGVFDMEYGSCVCPAGFTGSTCQKGKFWEKCVMNFEKWPWSLDTLVFLKEQLMSQHQTNNG